MNDDEQLSESYRAWVDARAADPPSFEALAPQSSPRRRNNQIMLLAVTMVSTAVTVSIVVSSVIKISRERARLRFDAQHTAWEVTMPWPAETDFLLNWPDDLASTYVLPSFRTQTNQTNNP